MAPLGRCLEAVPRLWRASEARSQARQAHPGYGGRPHRPARLATALTAWLAGPPALRPGVGLQIVSCDLAHTAPDTGWVHFSRSFVGEPGSPASLRHLAPCLGGTSSIDAEACLARIISFRQEPPTGPVWPDTTSECAKQQMQRLSIH